MAPPRFIAGSRFVLGRPQPQQIMAPLSTGVDGIVYTPKVSPVRTKMPPFTEVPVADLLEQSPGTRCPTCASQGKEVWVIPGRCCGYCGTPCD